MNEEREFERHKRVIEQIKKASNKEELPNISLSTISSYLASNVYFDDVHISQTLFKPVVDAIVDYGFFVVDEVKEVFLRVLRENYPNKSEEEYFIKYKQIANSPRISNILNEIGERNRKIKSIQEQEDLREHRKVMKEINDSFVVKDLPRVGVSELNKKIQKAFNNNDYITDVKISNLKTISDAFLNDKSMRDIEWLIYEFCNRQPLSDDKQQIMARQIFEAICLDKTIEYVVEEIKAKEKRKLKIYKIDHEDTMQIIKDATRITQLPPNLTTSSLTSYLSGNSVIFKNGDKLLNTDLKTLTNLLLKGRKWEDKEILSELQRLCIEYYATQAEVAFKLLYDKLKGLPKTYYLVEEINASKLRQKEFIDNSCSNVNVYFIPNNKSPIDGGRFYNCYINRATNLDLGELLPLDLNEIVPPEMDIDSVEWFIQEYHDKTFKAAGGIILNKDETIGNVNVFRPNDGNVVITTEEKSKYDELIGLSESVKKIIKKKKEETAKYDKLQEQFLKMQKEFLVSQKEFDEELGELEEKMDKLFDVLNLKSNSKKR